ncbi:hypothetical protein MRS44_005376 [Fusarium solani]|uniref:uncharacterized protein n=1 Tax=Fusarium solani TaxID=169388 RepID=UPI0032C48986|nr:hypothetical protein MRS44_005376 [Fusarium solani]
MPKHQEVIFRTGSTLPGGDHANLTSPPESGTPKEKGTIYFYIDESNFWIGGKTNSGENWTYDAESFLSLHVRETAIGKEMERDDYEKWESQEAMVDERRGPTLPDASEDNRKEEVDTALVAHSVLEACQGFKNPSMRREFVIVSGDRDMRPAVDIIYGGDYPAPIHAWAWKETVSNVYKDLHRSWKPVTLHFLDDHLDCIRDKGKETLEEEKNGDNGFQLVFPSRKRRGE